MTTHNNQSPSENTLKTTSYVQKLSLMAGSLSALYMLPSAANAAIVHKTTPLSISFSDVVGTTVDWDVDGGGTVDFQLGRSSFTSTSTSTSSSITYTYAYSSNTLVFSSAAGGKGVVGVGESPINLANGFPVRASLAGGYGFINPSSYLIHNYISSSRINGGSTSTISVSNHFHDWDDFDSGVDGYLGFAFDISGNTHYGWATINLDLDEGSVTLKEWAYESTSETCIAVGDTSGVSDCPPPETTPEPTSALALLSMGAAGVYRWRKQKQLLAQAEKNAA